MVVIPGGEFLMGSNARADEQPQHKVTFRQAFAAGKYPVTFAEWDAAVAQGGIPFKPEDEGWGRGRRPVINVSWNEAQAYVRWLSERTRQPYRLLSEAEWEYVCRARTTTAYFFGDSISNTQAQFLENNGASAGGTIEVGSFPANAFGLYDLHGNVWEWCDDCWNNDYNGAPSDGTAWMSGVSNFHVLRGGSWDNDRLWLRSTRRWGYNDKFHNRNLGFRVARTLTP